MARPAGLEPATAGLAYLLPLSRPQALLQSPSSGPWLDTPGPPEACCVWGLDYLFTVSGAARIVSTDPGAASARAGFHGIAIVHGGSGAMPGPVPLRFPRYSAVHFAGCIPDEGSVSTQRPMLYPVELRAR